MTRTRTTTEYETVYVHDADDGQAEFTLRFTVEPGSDGKGDGHATAASVDDVRPRYCDADATPPRGYEAWLDWFDDHYGRDREFTASVDAACLKAATEESIARAER